MALKGQAKREYQRDYMRKRRGSNAGSNSEGLTGSNKSKMGIPGLEMDGNKIIGLSDALKSTTSPVKEQSNPKLPRYNPRKPQIGQEVTMPGGRIVVVPNLDQEGNIIPEM